MASELQRGSFSCKTRLAVHLTDAHGATNRAQQAGAASAASPAPAPPATALPGEPQQKLPVLSRRRPSETERQAVRTSRILAGRLRSSGRAPSRLGCHTVLPHLEETPLSTADWHLPSTSTSTKPHAAAFQRLLKGQGGEQK